MENTTRFSLFGDPATRQPLPPKRGRPPRRGSLAAAALLLFATSVDAQTGGSYDLTRNTIVGAQSHLQHWRQLSGRRHCRATHRRWHERRHLHPQRWFLGRRQPGGGVDAYRDGHRDGAIDAYRDRARVAHSDRDRGDYCSRRDVNAERGGDRRNEHTDQQPHRLGEPVYYRDAIANRDASGLHG